MVRGAMAAAAPGDAGQLIGPLLQVRAWVEGFTALACLSVVKPRAVSHLQAVLARALGQLASHRERAA